MEIESAEQEVLGALAGWLRDGQHAWLCTIVEISGSSPRPLGSIMACAANGRVCGSLSGGCVEEDLIDRLRAGELATRFGRPESLNFGPEERRTLPFIAVAAYLAATAITDHAGRTNVFAMMEPFLPRLLGRAGIHFQRAGSDVDFRGIRAPYFITTQSALEHMEAELKALYECIRVQLYGNAAGSHPAPALRAAAL